MRYTVLPSIKSLNTFAIDVCVKQIISIYDELSLYKFCKKNSDRGDPILILGGGSNVLFLENYKGIVLLNRIKGIFITENQNSWKLRVGAGEKWHELVMYTLDKNISGLENLVYIPGYVGAAPINNIGAYGVELSQICEYVDVLELENGYRMRFDWNDCCFQYRGSIFKNHLYKYVITFVGLKLSKLWKPILHYLGLRSLNINMVTPRQISDYIVYIRKNKLPDPIVSGNAGSFFKHPILNIRDTYVLFQNYSKIPYYKQSNGTIKLLAGWLIENCKLKGYTLGEASVYSKHALVLINNRQKATGTEVAALAFYIYNKVANKFNIYLQPEVRLIGDVGEINPEVLFKKIRCLT